MQPPPTSPTSNLSAKQCHCRCLARLQHSTFSKAYTRPKHRTHTQLYGDATESAVAVGLGRLSYTARGMDGESVPIWLNFGVGKGLLCSPRLSWVVCFAAARLFPDCRGARGFPGSRARRETGAAPPGPPSHGQNLEVGSFCTRPQTANSGPAEQVRGHLQGKEQGGPPHHCATKARPPVSVR